MIEKVVIDFLSDQLSVGVYGERPDDPPVSYVIVEKTGGGKENHICRAMLAIQSYADTLYEASLLNEAVKDAMENLITIDSISRCSLNSDYNFTDTAQKKYRYQAIFDLVHY